jgi:hypothetical protein
VVATRATGQDWDVVAPVTVWMVHLGAGIRPSEVRGTLTLGDDGLEFTGHESGVDVRVGYDSIRRAKRIRGSPVLLVDWREGDADRRTGFYFSQPPPLEGTPRSPTITPRGPFGPFTRGTPSRRQVARMNVGYLRSTNAANRELLRAWERAVTERAAGRAS